MILHNCEVWFCKLDPKRPNSKFNKKNPTWECQIRTTDKTTKKKWEEAGLSVKAVVPDEGEPYFRVNLRKKSIKEDGGKASPVRVIDGKMNDLDPNIIGNGSLANIRIFQYDYNIEGKKGTACVLMGVQITKHKLYTPKPRDDDFEETDMETIAEDDTDDVGAEQATTAADDFTPAAPSTKQPEKVF